MMDKRAYTQAYRMIEILPEKEKKKIPDNLIMGIKNNMDESYEFEIDDENLDDIELLDDTEKILSVIYTDYLATDEEKKIIKNKEMAILREKEKQKKIKYSNSYYNFHYLGKEEQVENEKKQTKEISKIPQEKWYKKFIKMIKKIIHK